MTIERDFFEGPITFTCDGCGEKDSTHCTNFGGALAKFKAHGGVAIKGNDDGDEWEHYCRSCQS